VILRVAYGRCIASGSDAVTDSDVCVYECWVSFISLIIVTFSKLKLEFIPFDLQIAREKIEAQMIYNVV
jgi:hypothetical protein